MLCGVVWLWLFVGLFVFSCVVAWFGLFSHASSVTPSRAIPIDGPDPTNASTCLLACRSCFFCRYEILRGLGVMWSEPILVDWEKEEEKIEYPWREWGFVKVDEEQDEISVDPEFGLKDADPLL